MTESEIVKIEERVLLEYDKIIRAQEEVNMQEVQQPPTT